MLREHGLHQSHCCALHGCKYGREDCPVVTNVAKQDYICEFCDEDGIENVEQIEEYNNIKEQVKKAIENGKENIIVSVDFLSRILVKH